MSFSGGQEVGQLQGHAGQHQGHAGEGQVHEGHLGDIDILTPQSNLC